MIAAESRLRHGIAGQVLVHAVSLAAGLSFPVAGCEGMAQGKEALHAHHEYLSIGIG